MEDETLRENCQFLRMTSIADNYKQLQESMKLEVKGNVTRNRQERLVNYFGKEISFIQRTGAIDIVYTNNDCVRKVLPTEEEKVKTIAKLIKRKIQDISIQFCWPPSPEGRRM